MSSETVLLDTPTPASSPSGRSRGRRSAGVPADTWRVVGLVWLVHWLLTQVPATLAYHFGSTRPERLGGASWAYAPNVEWHPVELSGLAHWFVEPMRLWDGSWYRLVSIFGYEPGKSALAAFFPAYPWLMKWGHQLTGWSPETIGYIISNVAFFGALTIVYLIVSMDFSPTVAQRTLWAVALFPTSFFFTAVYTESLFLLLAATALYTARRRMWWLAGLLGLIAALTRSAGVMLLAPFAVIFIQQHGWDIRRWFPNAIPAALPALGPVIYGWILVRHDMKFTDWITQQWQWNRFSAMPWQTFDCTLNGCVAQVRSFTSETYPYAVQPIDWGWIGDIIRHPTWSHFTSFAWRDRMARGDVLEFVVTILAFALVLIGLRRLPLYYTAFTVPPLIVPLFSPSSVHPLMSMPRFVLPLFPLFVMIALLIPNRRVGLVLAGISTVLLILLTMQFAQWYWVA
ncbi:MAG: mannosyltransferase family protein [Thermomicrobiales bacterium]